MVQMDVLSAVQSFEFVTPENRRAVCQIPRIDAGVDEGLWFCRTLNVLLKTGNRDDTNRLFFRQRVQKSIDREIALFVVKRIQKRLFATGSDDRDQDQRRYAQESVDQRSSTLSPTDGISGS